MRRGTARAANSIHVLVYGKTGTSSDKKDALFVGLTQNFVGTLWVAYTRPTPMPGVHGGGDPGKAFARLTDFFISGSRRRALLKARPRRRARSGSGPPGWAR